MDVMRGEKRLKVEQGMGERGMDLEGVGRRDMIKYIICIWNS